MNNHILITVNAAWNIWNFRRQLVTSLLADGHRVTILAPPDASVPDLEGLGCRFVDLDMNAKGLGPLQNLGTMLRLRRHFTALGPDVILSYTVKNNTFGAMAARPLKIPFLPNVTGLGTAFLSGGPLQAVAELLYRHAFRRLPVVFFQNSDDLQLFLDRRLVHADQARLLPGSGIDLDRFQGAEFSTKADAPVFLMIARLIRDKGVLEFVEAARKVKAQIPGARFQLLGAIGAENRTAIDAKAVKTWSEEGVIEYLGTTEDVRPFIATADCIVLPSYREGAPRTLIEAAAMARPLIATDVPGCRSVIDDCETGFLCKIRDADSLATACLRFHDLSRDAQIAMGLGGRAKMEREFDDKIVIAAYRVALAQMTEGLGLPEA